MTKNPLSQSEIKNSSTKSSKKQSSNLFNYINDIKTDNVSNSIFLKDLNITYAQAQCLSGFKSNSFSSTELYFDFYKKVNQIESIYITDSLYGTCHILRIMILISLLSINDEGGNTHDLNLNLKKINNEEIKQEEIDLANRIRNIDKVVDLINEGWIINSINYEQNDVNTIIESINFTKGSEKISISPRDSRLQSALTLHQPFLHSYKGFAPSSPHSNQHSMNRQKRQSTRQFDRTDYSNESSNYNEDYDYYTDDDDELLKDTFLTEQNETRLSLSRRTNSEPFIEINPMNIFDNDKSKNDSKEDEIKDQKQENKKINKAEEIELQPEIEELDIIDIKPRVEIKKKNNKNNNENQNKVNDHTKNNWKNNPKQNNSNTEDIEDDYYNYSYSSNSSDFDYNYYSSGEEELTTSNPNGTFKPKQNEENLRNYSNKRRRHRHRHHHISKRIKSKIELRKLEESPRRTTQLYIDEFDDVRKLHSSHNKQQQNYQINVSPQKMSKNNNKRDFEDDFNDSDDSDESEVPSPSHQGSIKPSFSSPSNVSLSLPYELIDFTDNKNNFNEINDQELDDEDENQGTLQINLNVKLNFNQKTIQKKKKIQSILNDSNEIDEEEDDDDDEMNPKINKDKNKSNSINDLVEINDFIYDNEDDNDNENSSSDSNEDFDDLVCMQKSKNNNKNSSNENFVFEINDDENDDKILPMLNDDIYCSEPFPTGNGNSSDNALLSPNHRKLPRSTKKRII